MEVVRTSSGLHVGLHRDILRESNVIRVRVRVRVRVKRVRVKVRVRVLRDISSLT